MKSLRTAFKTSKKLETEGITFEVADTRLVLARAGGANEKYNAAMTAIAEKHKRAIANNLLSDPVQRRMLYEVYAEHVVLKWETNIGTDEKPEWVSGIRDDNDKIIEASFENIVAAFHDMPDFFLEVKATAEGAQYYRESLIKGIAGN